MRNRSDLDSAFALLDRLADTLAVDAPSRVNDPAPLDGGQALELVQPTDHRLRRRGRVTAGLATAAAVAVALVIAGPWRTGDSDEPAGGLSDPTGVHGPAPKSLGFTIDPALGMTVVRVSAGADETGIEMVDRTRTVDVNAYPASAGKQVEPGLPEVDVNGSTGYYTDGTTSGFVEPPRDTSTPAPPTPTPPDTAYAKTIEWQYAPGAWAFVLFQGETPTATTEADLLRVARAVHFGGDDPLRSAISMTTAPAGMHLVHVAASYYEVADNAPYETADTGWDTMAAYETDDAASDVNIEATSAGFAEGGNLTDNWTGGSALTIAGRPAYWLPDRHELDVDAGNGAYLALHSESLNEDQLVAIVDTITVTPHPADRAQWFDARTALP